MASRGKRRRKNRPRSRGGRPKEVSQNKEPKDESTPSGLVPTADQSNTKEQENLANLDEEADS